MPRLRPPGNGVEAAGHLCVNNLIGHRGFSSTHHILDVIELPGMSVAAIILMPDCCEMFLVNIMQAAVIRSAYEIGGTPRALSEFRRQFPGLMNDETAALCARMIAGWKPFGPGRVGRHCSIRVARQAEIDQRAA